MILDRLFTKYIIAIISLINIKSNDEYNNNTYEDNDYEIVYYNDNNEENIDKEYIKPSLDGINSNKHEDNEDKNAFIFHHISDDYKYTVFDTEYKGKRYNATLYLPIILISKKGVDIFLSNRFYDKNEKLVEYKGYFINGHKIEATDGRFILDISITKNVFAILVSILLLLLIFLRCSIFYWRHDEYEVPKGFVGAVESVFSYIIEDVLKPNFGHKYKEYLPYLMTLFFFILINNLLGLLPGSANVTGDISVTACLAFITFLYTNINGTKHYWAHTFKPDTPTFLYPIMIPIEVIGLFTKPFTLLIRLFANMTSGHIILLSIINLGFMFNSYAVGVGGVLISTFMILLKLLVAFLQAYVFTLLSSIYIGGAVHEE